MEDKKVIFSGMRPTGRLHLGNYLGALQNWVALQDEYNCIYAAVDVHWGSCPDHPFRSGRRAPNTAQHT